MTYFLTLLRLNKQITIILFVNNFKSFKSITLAVLNKQSLRPDIQPTHIEVYKLKITQLNRFVFALCDFITYMVFIF